MSVKSRIIRFLQSDWFLAGCLLIIYLLANGYTFGWDDQHLEIPLLKSLIDPSLYTGDYYVESLKRNFTSLLYPLLARIISTEQVPAAYLSLYLLSRYFFLFWAYKLWRLLSGKRLNAFLCVNTFILLGRVEEFLYRTFSHQEFALAFIFAGIYFFYKERYLLAAMILGFAANFHALYSLFPFTYLVGYLLLFERDKKVTRIFQTIAGFAVFAAPFIFWTAKNHFTPGANTGPGAGEDWLKLYQLACPQNFTFLTYPLDNIFENVTYFLRATYLYVMLAVYFALNLIFNDVFKKDRKTHALLIVGSFFILVSFLTSYVWPNAFFLNLNLVRHAQYMLFILMGYSTILLIKTCEDKSWLTVMLFICLFSMIRFIHYVAPLAGVLMICLLSAENTLTSCPKPSHWKIKISLCGLFSAAALTALYFEFFRHHYSTYVKLSFAITCGCVFLLSVAGKFFRGPRKKGWIRIILPCLPFAILLGDYTYYHHRHLFIEKYGTGFWQLQRNWIDMQNYVKDNTPKEASLLVPYDMEMGGFRISSERKIICSYRDCGIIGFDYQAAVEWQKRVEDIAPFQVYIKQPLGSAIKNALVKYQVDYIVFMRYFKADSMPFLHKIYENSAFVLYQVVKP